MSGFPVSQQNRSITLLCVSGAPSTSPCFVPRPRLGRTKRFDPDVLIPGFLYEALTVYFMSWHESPWLYPSSSNLVEYTTTCSPSSNTCRVLRVCISTSIRPGSCGHIQLASHVCTQKPDCYLPASCRCNHLDRQYRHIPILHSKC